MKLSFHRARWIEFSPKNGAVGPVRVFRLEVGVTAPIDPLSGMTVNLVVMDGWLDELALQLEQAADFERTRTAIPDWLRERVSRVGAALVRVRVLEGDEVHEWAPEVSWSRARWRSATRNISGGEWPGQGLEAATGGELEWRARSGDWFLR